MQKKNAYDDKKIIKDKHISKIAFKVTNLK